eukprot:5905485-Amphidinium_carterae.1
MLQHEDTTKEDSGSAGASGFTTDLKTSSQLLSEEHNVRPKQPFAHAAAGNLTNTVFGEGSVQKHSRCDSSA